MKWCWVLNFGHKWSDWRQVQKIKDNGRVFKAYRRGCQRCNTKQTKRVEIVRKRT